MGRRTRTFLITAVAAVATLMPAAVASAGTLDQQQTVSNFGGLQVDSTHSKAQTFTAGLTGQLDQVDLALSGMSVITPLTVQIRDGSATGPGNTVLASASVPTSAVTSSESFVPITFASPPSVTAGTQYSIVALNASPAVSGWFWYSGQIAVTSAYEGGRLYGSPSGAPEAGSWVEGNSLADFEFKTYVAPPSNDFSLDKATKNKRKGTAKLEVNVPGPGELELAKTKKVKGANERAEAAGSVTLRVRSRGKARKKLDEKGKVRVAVELTFAPDGGDPAAERARLKLVKK
jgi:hypothetical protein